MLRRQLHPRHHLPPHLLPPSSSSLSSSSTFFSSLLSSSSFSSSTHSSFSSASSRSSSPSPSRVSSPRFFSFSSSGKFRSISTRVAVKSARNLSETTHSSAAVASRETTFSFVLSSSSLSSLLFPGSTRRITISSQPHHPALIVRHFTSSHSSSSSASPLASSSSLSSSSSSSFSSSTFSSRHRQLSHSQLAAQLSSLLHSLATSPPHSSLPSLPSSESFWSAVRLFSDRIPEGFKNFIPKKRGPVPSASSQQQPSGSEQSKEPPSSPSSSSPDSNSSQPPPSSSSSDSSRVESSSSQNASPGEGQGAGSSSSPPNPQKKRPSDDDESSNPNPNWKMAAAGLAALFLILQVLLPEQRGREITFQDFRTRLLEPGKVAKLVVDSRTLVCSVHLKPNTVAEGDVSNSTYHFHIGSVESFERQLLEAQRELDIDPADYIPVQYRSTADVATKVVAAVEFALTIFMVVFMYRTISGLGSGFGVGGKAGKGGGKGGLGGVFGFGKSPATMIKPGEMTKITFADVAGLDEAKVEVMEFVKFLKSPQQFTKLGAKIPKGALLVGPPGTGKTLLAKAMAGEASVPFFSISGSDFIEMFVGVGPSRVRDLFAQARQNAPCMIFIDEIDAVGRSRSNNKYGGGNDERENTLNQLLVEMDGFNSSEGVVVLAGTNRKDILDKALLRPGRFDRQITIDKPDLRGRAQIFLVHLRPLTIQHDRHDLANRLAALTPGFAGADIANLCNEAALIAARSNKNVVELVDFEKAADRVIGGLEKHNSIMTAAEKKLVAYHEAGHAVIGWFLEHADPLLKVTIVPRGNGALGFAQYLPKELSLYHQGQLSDMMCMTLGGRAAEQIFFERVSTGAADDLKKVTRIAQAQISTYGMSTKLGNVSYDSTDEQQQFVKPFSEQTAQTIDEEVRELISTAYERTKKMIVEHKLKVEALAERLIRDETVNHDVIVEVLGPRPFVTDAYSQWMKNQMKPKDDAATQAEDEEKKKKEESEEKKNKNNDKDGNAPILQPILNPI